MLYAIVREKLLLGGQISDLWCRIMVADVALPGVGSQEQPSRHPVVEPATLTLTQPGVEQHTLETTIL